MNDFATGVTLSSTTWNLSAAFVNLIPDTTYYAHVKALNHSDISTEYLELGSTKTNAANAPSNLVFSTAAATSLTGTWDPSAPAGDSYTLQVSTDAGFGIVNGSSNTDSLSSQVSGLLVNTTYYGRVNSIINGSSSVWSASNSTATLAVVPGAAGSSWTVHTTSLSVTWALGGNPVNVTKYVVELSTVSGLGSGTIFSSTTYALTGTFLNLSPDTTYYAQVKALNHFDIETAYEILGSTKTQATTAPTNLVVTTATANSLSASWSASSPVGDSYTLQVSTDVGFGIVNGSSTTDSLSSQVSGLAVNTTYYVRANSILNGSSSVWTSYVTTATLADIPATAVSTWSVNITSLTVSWTPNANPLNVTKYIVDLSTVSDLRPEQP